MSRQDRRPAARPRSRLPREQRISDILHAAQEVLEEFGYENAALAEVAKRAGVVEGTVYHYFETKRDLYISVAEMWYEQVLESTQPDRKLSSTFERLRELIWRELQIIRDNPAVVRFILMELRPNPTYRSMKIFAMSRKFTSGITEVLKEGVAHGELVAHIPLRAVRDMIFGGIEHQTWAFLRREGDFSVEEAANAIAYVVYNGLKLCPAPSPEPQDEPSLTDRVDRLEQLVSKLGGAAG